MYYIIYYCVFILYILDGAFKKISCYKTLLSNKMNGKPKNNNESLPRVHSIKSALHNNSLLDLHTMR